MEHKTMTPTKEQLVSALKLVQASVLGACQKEVELLRRYIESLPEQTGGGKAIAMLTVKQINGMHFEETLTMNPGAPALDEGEYLLYTSPPPTSDEKRDAEFAGYEAAAKICDELRKRERKQMLTGDDFAAAAAAIRAAIAHEKGKA